ncbi:MAG: sensor domain-containing diguanylate cyclase [Candidatus Zhuqueibacterota bacterium]
MAENYDALKSQLAGLQKKYAEIEALNHSLNDRLLELYSLYQISLTLANSVDLDEILKSFRKLFQKTFNVDHFGIFLLDDCLCSMSLRHAFGLPEGFEENSTFKMGENIFGQSAEREEVILVPDISRDNNYLYFDGEPKTGSFLVIPILLKKKHPLGVLSLHRRIVDSFTKNEITLFKKVSKEIAKVLDKTFLFRHTRELSITDELTGLYNRRYFNQRYEREVLRAKRYKRPLSVIMVDIDYFKNYNDINGHILGDEVLKKVANSLESNLRKADIVARYGGEEFVILLPEIDKSQADQVAEKLRLAIEKGKFPREEYQPKGKVTISLGLATLPNDSSNSQELLECADRALYRAKANGRNCVATYSPNLNGNNILPLTSRTVAAGK